MKPYYFLFILTFTLLSLVQSEVTIQGDLDENGIFKQSFNLFSSSELSSSFYDRNRDRRKDKCKIKVKCPAAENNDISINLELNHGNVEMKVNVNQ